MKSNHYPQICRLVFLMFGPVQHPLVLIRFAQLMVGAQLVHFQLIHSLLFLSPTGVVEAAIMWYARSEKPWGIFWCNQRLLQREAVLDESWDARAWFEHLFRRGCRRKPYRTRGFPDSKQLIRHHGIVETLSILVERIHAFLKWKRIICTIMNYQINQTPKLKAQENGFHFKRLTFI